MFQPNDHIAAHVDDYLHDLLPQADGEHVRRHCETCAVCKEALDQARKRLAALQTVPAEVAPEPLVRQAVQRVEDRSQRRRRLRFVGIGVLTAAAAAIVILTLAHLYYTNVKASPHDLLVLGQSSWLRGGLQAIRIRLLDTGTKDGVAGVPVDVELRDPSRNKTYHLASFTTDGQGTGQPRFELPECPDGSYRLRVTAKTGTVPDIIEQAIEIRRSWQLMLSTDKPVYQPGQTILMRSLALRRPDLKPVAGQDVTFTITDHKGNMIFKRQDVTSKFGISSAECPLAGEILEGAYAIQCKVGDTASKSTVEVRKYVLPKFKINVEMDKPYYEPGQRVSGSVQADYFFGKPVSGGNIELEAVTTDVRPQTIKKFDLKTDDHGKAKFEFVLPQKFFGREQDGGDARFALQVTLTDAAGQKEVKSVARIVTTSPLRVEVIPENGTLVRNLPNTIYLWASYADGRPAAKAKIIATGSDKELVTNELGVASVEVTPTVDEIGLTVRVNDGQGAEGKRTVRMKTGVVQNFIVRTDKAVYDGGQSVKLSAIGGGVEPIFVDFIKDGQTILTESVELNNGRGSYQFDLPPDLFGTIEMSAYRFQSAGLPVRTRRLLYVRPARQLNIAAKMDHGEYRPGKQAKMQLTLTDDKGKPTPGAVSLAAVDEAVFAVLDQAPGMEKLFFTLEQKLLQPVYAIYGSWSPDEVGAESRREFDQALFSRTAQTADEANLAPKAAQPPGRFDRRRGMPVAPGVPEPPQAIEEASTITALYSFVANSLPAKLREVEEYRQSGVKWVETAWIWFFVVLGIVGYLSLWELMERQTLIVLHVAAALLGTFACVGYFISPGMGILMLVITTAIGVAYTLGSRDRQQGADQRANTGGFSLVKAAVYAGGFLLLCLVAIGNIGKGASQTFQSVANSLSAGGGVFAMNEMGKSAALPPGAPAQRDIQGIMNEPMAKSAPPAPAAMAPAADAHQEAAEPLRVREFFPETLLWKPEVVTDDNGQASVLIELADSITTWRLSASAVSADGRLGGKQEAIRVFQPFFVDLNLPVALTRGDEAAVHVVVYNYLNKPQKVALHLDAAPWFELQDKADQQVELPAGSEPRALYFRIKVTKVGLQYLQVTAIGEGVQDAIKKQIEVVPDGRLVEAVANGQLQQPAVIPLNVPPDAIEGSVKCYVKLYPSTFSQLVEGLDGIFRQPYGCFEQTSSTTYPNVLALEYLRKTKKNVPDVEAKARQYIHLGYQRLLSFEIPGGGFDWFGRPPANQTLTAYGLLEFTDMAKVHDVDPKLLERTRAWLLARRDPKGFWRADRGMLNDGLASSVQRGRDLEYSTTAYVAWAVFSGPEQSSSAAESTKSYLTSVKPENIGDPYVLALACNAMLAIDAGNRHIPAYLERLDSLKQTAEDGKLVWWQQAADARTSFYGSGRSGSIETTALAALAFLKSSQFQGSTRGALSWLVKQKDSFGAYHGTQSTVLALKALIAGTGASLGGDKERRIELALDGATRKPLVIPVDQGEVMQQIDLSDSLAPGQHQLTLTEKTDTAVGYQVVFRYHVPGAPAEKPKDALAIDVTYDRKDLQVGDQVTATAHVVNQMGQVAPMVILDLPIPGGFAAAGEDFAKLVTHGTVAKFQITARSVIVYLRGLEPGKPLDLRYRLNATMPVKVAVPAAKAYEYYDKEKQGVSKPDALTVKQRA